jgi:hypothetical protein
MRANECLSVKAVGTTATFTHNSAGWMYFRGASCIASLPPNGGGRVNMVSVSIPHGQQAVVALNATKAVADDRGRTHYEEGSFLIPIIWEDNKMVVDLDSPFIAAPDRLGQIDEQSRLVVTVGNQRFASSLCVDEPANSLKINGDGAILVEKGFRFVKDPNLLCKFLVGDISLDMLEEAASPDGRSASEIELDGLREQHHKDVETIGLQALEIRSLELDLQKVREHLLAEKNGNKTLENEKTDLEAEIRKFRAGFNEAREMATKLRAGLAEIKLALMSGQFFGFFGKTAQIKTVLKNLDTPIQN